MGGNRAKVTSFRRSDRGEITENLDLGLLNFNARFIASCYGEGFFTFKIMKTDNIVSGVRARGRFRSQRSVSPVKASMSRMRGARVTNRPK